MCVHTHVCMCVLADLQQFFTGKLYVRVSQLKLPAEELLWSALSYDAREEEEEDEEDPVEYWASQSKESVM